MDNKRVILFAGTTEGRRLCEYLVGEGVSLHVCTATAYGESLLPSGDHITVTCERMGYERMCELIESFLPALVIDATHPYAREVTENIRAACARCSVRRFRLVREKSAESDAILPAETTEEAVRLLRNMPGNILVTTGSKELEKYTALENYKDRLYVRVLPSADSIEKCGRLGIKGRHLICMQGPFSEELNRALIREFDITCMVTKDGGAAGGYPQKYQAAEAAGIQMVVIGRPEEEGCSYEEAVRLLKKELKLDGERKQRVILAGIGPGDSAVFTRQAQEAFRQAELVIGAKRMADAAAAEGKAVYVSYHPEEMLEYIKKHKEYGCVAAVFSGDTGFYSGAAKLWELIRKEPDIEAEVFPGLSSVSYFAARLGISWEEASLVSVHGKKGNPLSEIRRHEKTFILTGCARDVRDICCSMKDAGLGDLPVYIGIRLSYEDEQIRKGKARDYTEYKEEKMALLYVENPSGKNPLCVHGLPDTAFARGDVPMTKEEVRCICLSKLRIRKNSVIYDVGAGTGSVAAEAALLAPGGHVYAVEKKADAVCLIRENSRRMGTDNLTIKEGEAPEALRELPRPDCVFIGGSGGALEEILETVIRKNPKVRVVINAVSLETVARAVEACKKIKKSDEDIAQITVAKAKRRGEYHMMMGRNPVYIISFTCDGEVR